jgi:hypothetical protein
MLSDHKEINWKSTARETTENMQTHWRLKNTLLNDLWIVEEIFKFLELNENEKTTFLNL